MHAYLLIYSSVFLELRPRSYATKSSLFGRRTYERVHTIKAIAAPPVHRNRRNGSPFRPDFTYKLNRIVQGCWPCLFFGY